LASSEKIKSAERGSRIGFVKDENPCHAPHAAKLNGSAPAQPAVANAA
jgi:hypothetical protein